MGRRAGKLLGSRLRGVAWIHAHMDKLCEARQVDQPIAVDVCACEEAAALLGGEHGVIKRAPEIFELLKADAERQLEEANIRLGEVRLEIYKKTNKFKVS